MTYHLGADYFEGPDGTFVSQPKKYIHKFADTYNRLFNEDPPKGYKTPGWANFNGWLLWGDLTSMLK